MIEPTEEMVEAVRRITGCSTPKCHSCTVKAEAAAAAVLALVERDKRRSSWG